MRSHLVYGIGFGVLTALATLVACSDSGSDDPSATDTDSGSDAGSVEEPDSAVTIDANVDAPTDAAPRTCSDQGFCRTVLPPGQVLRGVWGDGNGTVWTVSLAGSILRWDGAGWQVHATNAADQYFSIWGASATDIWVGGSSGLLHGTGATPATLVFTPVPTPGNVAVPITSIWGASATDIWAVGGVITAVAPFSSKGRAVHLANGTWTADGPAATNIAYMQVWGTPGTGVWIGGSSVTTTGQPGVGLFRRGAGETAGFATIALPPAPVGAVSANPSRVDVGAATADLSVIVLGAARTAGAVRKTSGAVWRGIGGDAGADGGLALTWSVEPRPALPDTLPIVEFQQTAVWSRAPNDVWATGIYGRLRHWDGTVWTEAALTVSSLPEVAPLYGIWGKGPNDFWVVGDNLAIHKSP
jgi:hypothetical protein